MSKKSYVPAIQRMIPGLLLVFIVLSPAELWAQGGEAHVYMDLYTRLNLSPVPSWGPPVGLIDMLYTPSFNYEGNEDYHVACASDMVVRARARSTGVVPGKFKAVVTPGFVFAPGGTIWVSTRLYDFQPNPLPPGEYHVGTLTLYDPINPPGATADFPLLPDILPDGWQFTFEVSDASNPTYIDPLVAIGYDYFVDEGPDFSSVVLPSFGDNLYDLWLWDDSSSLWVDSGADITGGSRYDFAPGGVSEFRILGIEPSAGLDPQDDLAFVTGLWFTDTGWVTMRQVPIAANVPIPAPGALVLAWIGLAGFRIVRRKLT